MKNPLLPPQSKQQNNGSQQNRSGGLHLCSSIFDSDNKAAFSISKTSTEVAYPGFGAQGWPKRVPADG
jgi:Zn-dependent metalloprotease